MIRVGWMAGLILAGQIAVGGAFAQDERPQLIRLGQSAAFSGPASELGKEMRLGIEAAVLEANTKKVIPNARLAFSYLDDAYEPNLAINNARELINLRQVFVLIGQVGTPTSRAAAPVAAELNIPFIAPFTGAALLRDVKQLPNVVNFRASYRQELDEMIDRLIGDRGIKRIGILYQNDSFGRSGYADAVSSLERYGLKPVSSGSYERNTRAVKTAVIDLELGQPEAVILVGAYQPAAEAIKWSKHIGFNPLFFNISFVGSRALERELGPGDYEVFMTQVAPDFHSEDLAIARDYRNALEAVWPGSEPNYVSFEGYISVRMLIAAIQRCTDSLERACLLEQFRSSEPFELGGIGLTFGPEDNQGSDQVYLTQFHRRGEFVSVESLNSLRSP